jgi:hypothetical protein
MTKDEALKLALEALEERHYGVAQIIIREALAQPVQLLATGFCTHEWIDDTKDKPQWRCVKCGKNYRREQA